MIISTLVQAVVGQQSADRFSPALDAGQWHRLAPFLQRRELAAGELLTRRGEFDTHAYLVEQGELQVFVTGGPPNSHRITVLRAGALVGEPALFCDTARLANVEAMTPCVVWSLAREQLDTLAAQAPELALAVLRAAGAVMALRMRANLERGIPLA